MTEDIFMRLLALAVVVFLVSSGLKRFFPKHSISISPSFLSPSSSYSIKELLSFLINNKETRIRLLITLGILFAIRMCAFIPSPGINQEALTEFFQSITGDSRIFLTSQLTRIRFSILDLGIMPFLSACVLIQLSSAFIPDVRRAAFGGEEGRGKIVKYSYILATVLALIQSYFISSWLENPAHFQGVDVLAVHGLPFRLITMVTLTGAVLLLLFLANIINRYGIGNGIAMIVIAGILMQFLFGIFQLHNMYIRNEILRFNVAIIITIFIGLLYLAFFFTSKEKKIELKDTRTQREFTMPLRASWVGKVPVSLAQSIYILPATIAALVATPGMQKFARQLMENTWLTVIITGALIVIFTYFYTIVVFKPENVQGLLKKYSFSYKSTDGKESGKYLDDNVSKLLIVTALLLFILYAAPTLIINLFKMPYLASGVFTGLNVLVLTGVFFDILSQLEFFYEKNKKSDKNWKIAYIAFDEIEAKIKSEYLKNKGIAALVEPLRFTWGMPIRTAVDQYRIYTPSDRVKESRILIG